MADKEISALTAGGALTGLEQVHAIVGGNSRRFYLPAWQLLGGAYTSAGIWDQSVDGTVASVAFTGLAGALDLLLIGRLVTKSASTAIAVRVSDDNGSSYYSGGSDYINIDQTGQETGFSTGGQLQDGSTTAARSGVMLLTSINESGIPKFMHTYTRQSDNRTHIFVGSTSPINAVQLFPVSGGNLTGGSIYCLARGLETS